MNNDHRGEAVSESKMFHDFDLEKDVKPTCEGSLSDQIERERIARETAMIGRFIVTEDAMVSFNNVGGTMVECQGRGCQRSLCVNYGHGLDELIRKLATDGWLVQHTDTMVCPKCSGINPAYFED